MWRNYLTVGLGALLKNRAYAFINIFGLTIGLAACLTVLLYIRYESSYDAWLPDADRTFQLQQWVTGSDDPAVRLGGTQMTSYVSGQRLRQFPQIEQVVYVGKMQPVILQNGQGTVSENFLFADGPLFDVLRIPFVRGDARTALSAPGQLILTETEAMRRFGTIDVVGRTLAIVASGRTTDYNIVGVVQDPPRNSHLALSVVARVDFGQLYGNPQTPFLTQWMPKNGWVYARLREGADVAEVMRQMPAWERRNIPDQMLGGERQNPGTNADWRLINVQDIHLGTSDNGMRPINDRGTIVALAVVGLLILGLALVNFINLSTARASQRAREVALRKVLGASRRQLVVQFLGESILLTALAMVAALALVEMILPALNTFLDAQLAVRYLGADGVLLPVVALVLLVGAAGGLYPAFFLSRFRPATVLKANQSSTDAQGSGRLRNGLVVAQFAVSIGLIICTTVIYAQTAFARSVDPGYRRDGIIQIGNIYRSAIRPVRDTLLREIGQIEGVSSVGRSTIGVATWGMSNMMVSAPGSDNNIEFELYRVDPGFFATMGIRTVAGRTFSESQAMDDSTPPADMDDEAAAEALNRRGYNVVINELAARQLGYSRPQDALGRTLQADDEEVDTSGRAPATVIGVVGNSRFRSIRDPVAPMIFLYDREQPNWLLVRYSGNPAEVRARIEQVWRRIAPEVPFEAQYSEDIVQELYDAEETRGIVFAVFATLAIVVACLGLFGLAAFTAERRTKEIGIRKVFGATVRDIVKLLVWQFSKPVVLANLIAWPIAWWVMREWLNGFDLRVPLGPEPFVLAGLLALIIAVGTIAAHAIRVARTNPIVALRYE